MTNAPFSALYYMFYTRMKGLLAGEDRPQTLVNFGCAAARPGPGPALGPPCTAAEARRRRPGALQLGAGSGGGARAPPAPALADPRGAPPRRRSAVTAAVAATMITQPTDVVRTRMQLALAGTTHGNALQTLVHVFKSQGPRALLSGAAPRVLKRTTQTALVGGVGCCGRGARAGPP